ncbi:MAG: hypothetical protein WCY84_00060 [Candidatus Cloacimonadaceae bacterium]
MNKETVYQDIKIDGQDIEITVDGQIVKGRFLMRERRRICIQITSPYQDFQQCSGTVPLIFLQVMDFTKERGDERAAEILSDIYLYLKLVEDHHDELVECTRRYHEKYEYEKHTNCWTIERQARAKELDELIKQLKKDLKAGLIDNVSYQKKLTPMKKEREEIFYHSEPNEYEIFEETFKQFEGTPVMNIDRETVINQFTPFIPNGI